jgi:antitoxin HicB
MYAVMLAADDNDTVLVTCPDLPEVATFGENADDAMQRAADAIEEALADRIDRREDIPAPSEPEGLTIGRGQNRRNFHSGTVGLTTTWSRSETGHRLVRLPPLTIAKVELYRAARAQGVSKAELARRLGWHGPQVDRLFDLNHRSTIEQMDQALRAVGKRLVVSVQDAA